MRNFKDISPSEKTKRESRWVWLVIILGSMALSYVLVGCASVNQELKEYRIETKHDGYKVIEEGYTDGFNKYPNYHERIEDESNQITAN